MDELLRLLEMYEAWKAGTLELDAEALAQLQTDIKAAAEDAAADAGDNPSEELLVALESAADAVTAIDEKIAEDAAAAAERAQRAQDALKKIRNADEDGGEADDAEADDEAEADADAESTEEESTEDTESEDTAEPIAAATKPTPKPKVPAPKGGAKTAARGFRAPLRRPAPPKPGDIGAWAMTAAGNLADIQAGKKIRTKSELADVMARGHELALLHQAGNKPTKIAALVLGKGARSVYGDDRFLTSDKLSNEQKIQEVVHPGALAASGGICVNPEIDYSQNVIGTDARPVLNEMLARFGAARGGVTTMPSPILTDVQSGVDQWTAANDVSPSDPATKPCVTIDCGDEVTTKVYAITHCIKFGNFTAEYFPELVDAWTQLINVWGARFSETLLLDAIAAGSTNLTVDEGLSSTRDVLASLDRITAGTASFYRDDTNWRLGLPFWFRNMTRADIARQLPVGTLDETLALADAQIDRWFAVRGLNTTWFWDGETGGDQVFHQAGDGDFQGWPDKVRGYLYPEGAWLGLDGGEIRLGTYRDDQLIGTNDAKFFFENMEAAHFRGQFSYTIDFDICPDGAVAATKDTSGLCAGGS